MSGNMSLSANELIVDNFAGGGGASTGIEAALGRPIDIAIDHDPEALAMHAANHPGTLHLCENVWNVDIKAVVAGRKVGLAWFSPDCKHFSKAKGGKPVEKRIRGLAWVALKWAGLVKPRVIMLENVEEFQTWGPIVDGKPCKRRRGMTFKRWVTQLRNCGYVVEWRDMRACDYGAPTIRKRLFLIARSDGQPIVWPETTHAGKPDLFLKPYRTAADCIDWAIPCPSIFDRKRPLAEATLRRIARGIERYVIHAATPFIVNLTHGGRLEPIDSPLRTTTCAHRGEKAVVVPFVERQFGGSAGNSISDPLGTTTAGGGGKSALVAPYLARVAHGERDKTGKKRGKGEHSLEEALPTVTASQEFSLVTACISSYYGAKSDTDARGAVLEQPLATQPTENRHALVSAFLAKHYGGPRPPSGSSMSEPVRTVTATDHNALVTSNLVKLRGTCKDGQPVTEPMATVSAQGTHMGEVRAFLLKYFGTDQNPHLTDPMHTITSKHRFGLVMVHGEPYQIVDIGMRMLSPRELFRAQGFPESYIIERGRDLKTGRWVSMTKTAQVRMCGNSVSPPPAEALVRAQFGLEVREMAA